MDRVPSPSGPGTLTEVSQVVPVAPPFGTQGQIPAGLETTIRTTARLTREYVANGGWGWVTEYARTLPQYVDDLTRDWGIDLYRRMRHDAQVESAVSTLVMAALAQGYKVGENLEKTDTGYKTSTQVADFCRDVLDNLERPLLDVLYEMGMGGATYGFKVAEQVYEPRDWGGKPKLYLRKLATKPQTATAFVVDAYNNVLGLVYTRPGAPIPSLTVLNPTILNSPLPGQTDPIIVPRSKFWVFSYGTESGDPRGTSLLRSAYHPWWVKGQVWKAYLAYLATFAQPSIVGFVSANADTGYLLDAHGEPLPTVSPQQKMATALEKIQNGAVGAFANDERVEMLQERSEGEPFVKAINLANREVTKAIIHQTLTTDEGEHMARAASEVHQDVFGLLVRFLKATLIGSFTRDVLVPLVLYNYGEEAVRKYLPVFSLGQTEHQDFAGDANAVFAGVRAGFFDESQYRDLDIYLGLPPRDPVAWAKKLSRAEALLDTAVQQPGMTGTTGKTGVAPTSGAGQDSQAEPGGETEVAQDTQKLTDRLVAKASAMRLADRLGTVGPA